jgi:hypothetical protein
MTGPSAGNCPAQPCFLTETSFAAFKLPDRCFRLSSVVAPSFNRELASSKHHAREGRTSYFDRRLSESTRTSSKSQPSGLHNLGAGVGKTKLQPSSLRNVASVFHPSSHPLLPIWHCFSDALPLVPWGSADIWCFGDWIELNHMKLSLNYHYIYITIKTILNHHKSA